MIGERIAHYEIVEQLVNVVTAGCSLLAVGNSNPDLRPGNSQKLAASREP